MVVMSRDVCLRQGNLIIKIEGIFEAPTHWSYSTGKGN